MRIKILLLLFLPCMLIADCRRPALLSLGAGCFDIVRPNRRMAQYQVEYKWDASWNGIQPFTGLMITQKGSVYFCFGALYDIFLFWDKVVITLSFAPGAYMKNGGKELGFPLEFRSSIALAYQFCNQNRLGLQFYHISNASLGFKNPGEESLVLFYGVSF